MSAGNDDVKDPIAARQDLADTIARQILRRGSFVAHLDSDGQGLADFEWAALLAGRKLGSRTRTVVVDDSTRAVTGRMSVMVEARDAGRRREDGHARLLDAVLAQTA
jgi:hypothetical protein